MKLTISLNGLDKSGKTTQSEGIIKHYGLVYPARKLKDYNGWPKLDDKSMSNWWFFDGKTEDVVRTIYEAVKFRKEDANSVDYPLVLLDRGDGMFQSVCVATVAARERCSLDRAKRIVESICGSFEDSKEERIFYFTGSTPEEMCKLSKRRGSDKEGTERSQGIYASYQGFLSELLLEKLRTGAYSHVIDATQTLEEVSKETMDLIDKTISKEIDPLKSCLLVGLGGLSECGKSRLGDYLRDQRGFKRVKIGSIIDKLAIKYSVPLNLRNLDIYSVGDELLATLFLEQLGREAGEHTRIVADSLRRFGFTKQVKRIMGSRFQIVYVETPEEIRIMRNTKDVGGDMLFSKKEVSRKDNIKKTKGADRIREISDLVLDNSGSFEKTCLDLDSFLRTL